jgi:hypothetical protein
MQFLSGHVVQDHKVWYVLEGGLALKLIEHINRCM